VSEPEASEPEGTVVDSERSSEGGSAPQAPEVELTVEALVEALEAVTRERDEYLATAQRAQADFENHRKQSQRRAEDQVQREVGSLVERLLPVLDACDGALAHGAAEVEPIASALLLTLEKEGLTRIDPVGQPFDPAEADAVVHEPGSGGEHVVAEVLRPGYAWRGRVLRPAMVRVTD
jgi:molecular chaperone GrpE